MSYIKVSYRFIPFPLVSSNSCCFTNIFVGAVSDNFDERINQKIFHAQIVVDNDKVAAETKAYQKIPEVLSFTDANGNDTTKEQVEANYRQIKLDVVEIIEREKERIANDPELRYLVEKEG